MDGSAPRTPHGIRRDLSTRRPLCIRNEELLSFGRQLWHGQAAFDRNEHTRPISWTGIDARRTQNVR